MSPYRKYRRGLSTAAMTDTGPPRKRPMRDAWRRLTERPRLPLVAYLGFFGVVALIRPTPPSGEPHMPRPGRRNG